MYLEFISVGKKKKPRKRFLCVFLFQVFDDQTMKCMTNIKFGDVCHVISRPGGSWREGNQEETRSRVPGGSVSSRNGLEIRHQWKNLKISCSLMSSKWKFRLDLGSRIGDSEL